MEQKRKARCPPLQLYQDNKGGKKEQMQAFASRPTLHVQHHMVIWQEIKKQQGSSRIQNSFQSSDLKTQIALN